MRNLFTWVMTIATVFGFAVRSHAEDKPTTRRPGGDGRTPEIPAIRLEAPDDPPGEPATLIETPAAVWTRGSFVSTQVNVTLFGGDLIGDAANEPSIAIDPTNPDVIVIGWRQFDTIASNFREAGWSYSHNRGLTWSSLNVIQNNVFRSDPVLDADADGNIYYYSLSTLTTVEMFKSLSGGADWTGPVPGFGGDKAWMVIDRTGGIGHGNIYAKWQTFFGCCGPNTFTRSIDGGASFMAPVFVPLGPSFGTLAVGPDGEVYVAGIEAVDSQNFNSIVVAKSTDAQDPFATPTFPVATQVDLGGGLVIGDGPNPAGLLGQVWVAVDHSDGASRGHVYLLASVDPPGSDPLDVMFSRSTDGGLSWSPPIRINDDPLGGDAWQWFGTLSVAPNGRIDVIWNDTRNTPGFLFSELHYAFSVDGGDTWLENIAVSPPFNSHLGFPSQDKLGDYYDMISDDTGVNIAYAATFNGGQDVYFLRIDVDCNGNGIYDEDEIADGITPDCNENGVPDDCEVDCQGNGIPDGCDVDPADPDGDGEVSPDENGNGIPDECEANAPLPADPPNDRKKNRYISLHPNNPGKPVKLKVTVTASLPHPAGVGSSWWVQAPVVTAPGKFPKPLLGPGECVALLGAEATAATIDWEGAGCQTLHVTGCSIEPTSAYDVRAVFGENESTVLSLPTALQPAGGRWWCDTVGMFDGVEWTPSQGVTNIDDAVAAIKTWQGGQVVAPIPGSTIAHLAVADVEPGNINTVVNFADVQQVLLAFQGEMYSFGPADADGNCP